MNVAEGLRAAAARVRKGWCQGRMSDATGNVCAYSAIKAVDVAGCGHALWGRIHGPITEWNDRHGQTAENVAATMEQAADQWEREQVQA